MKPTVEELRAAFPSVYGASGPEPVGRARPRAWGGPVDDPGFITLAFDVGRDETEVWVETRSDAPDAASTALLLVIDKVAQRALRFPLEYTVQHDTIELPVDGTDVSFDAYSCGRSHTGIAVIGSTAVRLVTTSRVALRALRLESLGDRRLAKILGRPDRRVYPDPPYHDPFKAPTLEEVSASFEKGAFGPTRTRGRDAHYHVGWGPGNETVVGVHAFYTTSGDRSIVVRTTKEKPETAHLIWHLLSQRVLPRDGSGGTKPLAFPFEVTVSRERITLEVDGRPTSFTAYVCGRRAAAIGRQGGNAVTIECSARELRGLSLSAVSPDELVAGR